MALATMLAVAANEPWCIPPDRAARLTVYQLTEIVIGPDRDSRGRVEAAGLAQSAEAEPTERERFDMWAAANKVPRWRAEQLWREQCQRTTKT